jgi:ABC-type transport system involved in Fe-S cluster assembly fused permease/ATPase subunit
LAATAAGEALSSFKTVTAFGGGKREVKKYASNLVTAQKAATKKGFNLGFAMVQHLQLVCCVLWSRPHSG